MCGNAQRLCKKEKSIIVDIMKRKFSYTHSSNEKKQNFTLSQGYIQPLCF